ncbi:hypothetical protein D7V68_03660 [Acinetobacter cumulans]|uniref:hypothetical protein n=1 Tax=Acinetobacter cumulans TaxID=2136182 RepID=UPI000EA2F04F|nr:hypothetical protein [Acinetobacter cumulans]RKG50355.1 hypothetical protein D7V68_03660 [Acinetobacter cumulans]
MNDFFMASNRPIKVGELSVHQLQMHNFDEWSSVAQVIKDFLNNHPDETTSKLFEAQAFESTQLIAHSLKYSIEQVIELFKSDERLITQLLDTVIKVNDAFFSEPKPKHRDDVDPRKKSSWFDVFQVLVSNGHQPESIMQMSYGSFSYYLKAAQKAERLKMRNLAIATRAQNAINKKFDAFIKSLEKDQ